MGRLIDAERKVHIQIYDDEHEEFRTHEMSIADVLDTYTDEGCPDAELSAQQWIPCKTRLPEESGTYLVSGKWGSGKVDVGDCVYLKEDGYFDTAWNFDVLAWMPLPECYKGE